MPLSCTKHPHESAQGACVACAARLCGICVLEPFGPNGAALCIPCALEVAGVRPGPGRRAAPGRRRRLDPS